MASNNQPMRNTAVMAMPVVNVPSDAKFDQELVKAGDKLVVVDFYATWCGPCQNFAPTFKQLAAKYPNAVFVKVDVDVCQGVAARYEVTRLPTFVLFKRKQKVDSCHGADQAALEGKIQEWYTEDPGAQAAPVKGHMDLNSFINTAGCECLNQSDDHTLDHALSPKSGYLESDCDEQFNQTVKLHSFKMLGPKEKGPKTVKLFINQPTTLDFSSAESMEPVQKFILTQDHLEGKEFVELRYVKFQAVNSLTVFIQDNQGEEETTQLDNLIIFGSPISTTNMSDFKRIAGKSGESH